MNNNYDKKKDKKKKNVTMWSVFIYIIHWIKYATWK